MILHVRNNVTKTQTSNFQNKGLGAGGESSRGVRIKKMNQTGKPEGEGQVKPGEGIWKRT